MVQFLPFRGLLPSLEQEESIAARVSPPYDVIDDEERRRLQSQPNNVTRLTLGGEEGSYEKVALLLEDWIAKGDLRPDKKDCFYLCRQSFTEAGIELTRTGIMGRLLVEPYEEGGIMPHEETSPKVKEDRLNLLRATATHLESIFCIFERLDEEVATGLAKAPELFSFLDSSGVKHSFARVSSKATNKAISLMLEKQKLLIADGHHRYETALRYSQENPGDEKKRYVLATLVASNDSGLVVRPTHRLYAAGGFSSDSFLALAAKEFGMWELSSMDEMAKVMQRSRRPTLGFVMKDGRRFVGEQLRPAKDDLLATLDTYVCEEAVHKRILIPMAEGKEIKVDFDHDAGSVERKLASGEWDMAVMLSPPKLETIWSLALGGRKMPKKSTYFWPKVWSGLVLYRMK
jgi:uncharacterized protein (DUF1015 family)